MATLAPRKSRVRVWLAGSALALYGLLAAVVLLWPTSLTGRYTASIRRFLVNLQAYGLPDWFGFDELEFTANALLFLPLGFCVALLLPQNRWWIPVVACVLVSTGIEIYQAVFLSGRIASPLDVISNTLGAALGVGLAVALRALVHARDRRVVARAMYERTGRLS